MAAGSAFSFAAQQRLDEAAAGFEAQTGMAVSVYVGATDEQGGPDGFAADAAAELHAAPGLVLVVVDPGAREMAIRTVGAAAHRIDDDACALAVLSMTTSFGVGDLVGGIALGIRMLGDAASKATSRHGRPEPTSSTVTTGV